METINGRNYYNNREESIENASTMVYEDNRWNGLWGEIYKLFDPLLQCIFPDLDQVSLKAFIRPNEDDEDDDCRCQNVLTIWRRIRNNPDLKGKYPDIKLPRHVGEIIKEKLLESDMIMVVDNGTWAPFTCDIGFVSFSLSRKWIAKSIHKMLKDGLDTWAPELGLERVVVDYPSLNEELHMDWFRRQAIRDTLIRMLEYSKVAAITYLPNCFADTFHEYYKRKEWPAILSKWFSTEEKEDGLIVRKQPSLSAEDGYKDLKLPFTLAKSDFDNAYKDLVTLWHGLVVEKADWMVYLTPVRQQEYIEMCFVAAKLEKWISSGDKPSRTSYVGYRACTTTKPDDNLLGKAKTRCEAVAQGTAAMKFKYTAEAVLDCASTYTCLKNHRLNFMTFDIDEMLEEEGNTFVYLLNRRAEICELVDGYREDIAELKKASELILENDLGWRVGEERVLEWHLLAFSDELEESCLSVSPHILCDYLYDLFQKFTSYYKKLEVRFVTETSTLLLCEATAMVMEKCFHLLGITPECSKSRVSITQSMIWQLQSFVKRPMYVKARDSPRTSRFELFSIRPSILTDLEFKKGKLFGQISVSDKYGLLSDKGASLDGPDFTIVPLFDRCWADPIHMTDNRVLHLGNPPTLCHSVPFSSSIKVLMELFVTTENNDACFNLCNNTFNIKTSDFWDKELYSKCGWVSIDGVDVDVDGVTDLHYILLKDAVDTDLEVSFDRKTIKSSRVRGSIRAYYGGDFHYDCDPSMRDYYFALLFQPDPQSVLENGQISLNKSMLAVPLKGSLIIEGYLMDVESDEVILNGRYEFQTQRDGYSEDAIKGIGCSLNLKVKWKYRDYYLANEQGVETQATDVQGTVSEFSGTSRKRSRNGYQKPAGGEKC